MVNGKLVLSLDFELLWGVIDKVDHKEKQIYFQATREVIPQILELFTVYEICCTWATVGMLFHKNWEEWEKSFPRELPGYKNRKLSPYEFGKDIKGRETENLCFAPDLVKLISETPRQELATHTYSHYYCSEEGQTPTSFKADMEKAIFMADKFGILLESLVFPRNQLNDNYLAICNDLGIKTVRSNPDNWYWKETQESSFLKKFFRTGDAYGGFNDKSYSIEEVIKQPGKPSLQKASRLLRPHSSNRFMNHLKLRRIKTEMTAAAKKKEIYHLWWHPHNFGNHPKENLKDLEMLLQHFNYLKAKYGFESEHMAGLHSQAAQINKEF